MRALLGLGGLLLLLLQAPLLARAAEPAVLSDAASGLQWTGRDNGADLNWPAARSYCRQLDLEGGGWRLPSRAELISLFDREQGTASDCGDYHCPLRLPLRLSGPWFWSAEPINAGKSWGVGLTVGQAIKLINDYAQDGRALCVRAP